MEVAVVAAIANGTDLKTTEHNYKCIECIHEIALAEMKNDCVWLGISTFGGKKKTKSKMLFTARRQMEKIDRSTIEWATNNNNKYTRIAIIK